MPQSNTSWIRRALLPALLLSLGNAYSQSAESPQFKEELTRQRGIYHDKEQHFVEGYVTDRTLEDYASALPAGFAGSLAKLGPQDRWLDIGAGRGQAMLDYYSRRYDEAHGMEGKPHALKARAVAMSVEDRRNVFWDQAVARLEPGQLRYVYNKTLREYSLQDLGQFQLITDVIGGFSYTANLSLFMEKTLSFLAVDGSFYTVLQDVRTEEGSSKPYYEGSPFLTQIRNAAGSDVGVCAWLKSISCVQVTCEAKPDWKPPIEVYRIHKVCDNVIVPAVQTAHFTAGTPPERVFKLADLPAPLPAVPPEVRKEAAR